MGVDGWVARPLARSRVFSAAPRAFRATHGRTDARIARVSSGMAWGRIARIAGDAKMRAMRKPSGASKSVGDAGNAAGSPHIFSVSSLPPIRAPMAARAALDMQTTRGVGGSDRQSEGKACAPLGDVARRVRIHTLTRHSRPQGTVPFPFPSCAFSSLHLQSFPSIPFSSRKFNLISFLRHFPALSCISGDFLTFPSTSFHVASFPLSCVHFPACLFICSPFSQFF